MGQSYKVIFAPRAARDLEAITHYIARHSGPDVAIRFGNRLIEKSLTLATFPERGRVLPETGEPYREIIFRTYRIVYRIKSGSVEIIRFWHAARGVPQIDSDEFGRQK